jgi:hypothetical protein
MVYGPVAPYSGKFCSSCGQEILVYPHHCTEEDRRLCELARVHEEMERRFGRSCRHEDVRGGRCMDCLRKVV